jgi:hypothetical protein
MQKYSITRITKTKSTILKIYQDCRKITKECSGATINVSPMIKQKWCIGYSRFKSCEMWCVTGQLVLDVSKNCSAFIFRVEQFKKISILSKKLKSSITPLWEPLISGEEQCLLGYDAMPSGRNYTNILEEQTATTFRAENKDSVFIQNVGALH